MRQLSYDEIFGDERCEEHYEIMDPEAGHPDTWCSEWDRYFWELGPEQEHAVLSLDPLVTDWKMPWTCKQEPNQ